MSHSTPTILKEILQQKKIEVSERKKHRSFESVREQAESASATRGFVKSIQNSLDLERPAVIAEIKKASPSKGVIREDFVPADIAQQYEAAGASCLSVLTDKNYFQGDEEFLLQARAACALPVLRKDFIVDPYQVYETRALGADCILFIAAAFIKDAERLKELVLISQSLNLDFLMEVHDEYELDMALELPGTLLGVNNRNLHTFETDLQTTFRLQSRVPNDRILVTESGIHSAADVQKMREHDIHSFLVGEAFMKQPDPGQALKTMFFD